MDVGTHALASLALTRAIVSRAPLSGWIFIIVAGTVADLDALSGIFGPSAYLKWHCTYTHSIVAWAIAGVLLGVLYLLLRRKGALTEGVAGPVLAAIFISGLLHLAMDACQADGITAFWPFSGRRVAADWLAGVDPWIIAVLVAAVLVPELARLVSDEIGARSKGPRGRVGAILGLTLVIFYVGARASFHASALPAIQGRTYRGELPRRASAYPEPISLFTWHAIVETDRSLQELTVDVAPGASFDPENGTTVYKPGASPMLENAQKTETARKFLRVASFPKASIEKTPDGYEVEIRDLRYAVSGEMRHEVVAVIQTDANGKVTQDELRWERDLRRR
jgi:membrane-bound metal-dependent hydrolase YbcI (DUF457 family)